MILCVGEILADMIGSERDGHPVYEQRAGGAPFNVACAAARFGAASAFVGSVGDDLIGESLCSFAASRGLCETLIRRDPDRNTTLAFVRIDARGERTFSFYRKNTADCYLPDVPQELLARADIVHLGSLMLREEAGRTYAARLLDRAHEAGKRVSFDVNFRDDIFRDREEALGIYREVIARADVIKFSEEEAELFREEYLETLRDRLVCITRGAAGSEWRFRGRRGVVPAIDVRPVDTTGAGDAFHAGLLTCLDAEKGVVDDAFLNRALRYANICGALNTRGKGAIEPLPTPEEIARYL